MLFPGIVDQDVKSAKFTNRLLHRGLAESGLAHVTCDGDGISALCLNDAACLACDVMLTQIDNGDIGELASIKRSNREPSDAACSRDEGDFALQSSRARTERLPIRLK